MCCHQYELKRQTNRTQMPVGNEKWMPFSGKQTADIKVSLCVSIYKTTGNHIRNNIQSEIHLQTPICDLPESLREINTTKPQQAKNQTTVCTKRTTTAQATEANQKQTKNQSNKQHCWNVLQDCCYVCCRCQLLVDTRHFDAVISVDE